MKMFTKPTDRSSLLHFRSHHPRQLVQNLPFGQFLRLKRNSISQQNYKLQESSLCEQLLNRGYPVIVINQAKLHVQSVPLTSLLKKQVPRTSNRIACGLEYIPLAQKIKNIIYKNWHIIEHLCGCQEKPFVGLRKTKTGCGRFN